MSTARRIWPLLAFAAFSLALFLEFWKRSVPIGVDFHTYEAAARVGLQQGWTHIYDQAVVAAEQRTLVPNQLTQPFLSPPTVAWLAAALAPLPYWPAYYVWAVGTLGAYAASVAWSATSVGLARWAFVAAAIAPWWILYAVHLGQVVPLVAAAVVLTRNLVRHQRSIAAGLVLSLVLLKPNTAFLVPFALLAAGHYRTFATWSIAGAALAGVALLTLEMHGVAGYLSQLTGPLPSGAAWLTVEGAFGLSGLAAIVFRLVVAFAALITAFRLRASTGLVIATGILASLLVAPYLHASDLCLLAAAAWMIWEERRAAWWRVPLAAGWLAASPIATLADLQLTLSRWSWVELVVLMALVVNAWRRDPGLGQALTGSAELRTRAPA